MNSIKKAVSVLSAFLIILNGMTVNSYTVVANDDISEITVPEEPSETTTSPQETTVISEEVTTTVSEVVTIVSETSTYESDSTTTETTKITTVLTPPNMLVDISDEWINSPQKWVISVEEGAIIYYKVSKENQLDWGSFTDSDAHEWNNGDELPEGEFYIKFWAVFPNDKQAVNDYPDIKFYRYDKTPPSDFKCRTEKFVVKNENSIIDNMSGIAEIYYTIDNPNLDDVEKIREYGKYIETEQNDGDICFSINLNHSLKGKNITIYVIDNAGNIRSTSTGNDITSDIDIPQLSKQGIVSISYDEEDKVIEKEQRNHEYGHEMLEKNPLTNHIYVSDKTFIKLYAKDEHLDSFIFIVKTKENSYNIIFEADEISVPDKINVSSDIFYIPFTELIKKIGLENKQVLFDEIVIKARDDFNNENDEKDTVTINDIFYDPSSKDDCDITFSLSKETFENNESDYNDKGLDKSIDAYFYGTENIVDISLKDDIGFANYSVNLYKINEYNNQKRLVSEETTDISAGNICKGEYTITTVVTDEEGKETVETKSVEVEYNAPAKTADVKTIQLTEDGLYELEITVTDIEGNKKTEKRKYIVDTTAPSIEALDYVEKDNILKYFTFGIYGSQDITLMIKVNDGFYRSGVSEKDVLLYWDKAEPYYAHRESEWLVFNLNPLENNSSTYENLAPHIVISDRMGNKNTYYFATNENISNVPNAPDEKLIPEYTISDEETGAILILETNDPVYTVSPSGTNYKYSGNKLYFGENEKADNSLDFTFLDDEGIDYYKIYITDENGQMVETKNGKKYIEKHFDKNSEPVKSLGNDEVPISLSVDDLDTGRYFINVELHDLAGNNAEMPNGCLFDYNTFYVDKTPPTIIENQYEVVPNLLKYFTFGIFGKSTITVSVKVNDNSNGIGVENVELFWNGKHSSKNSDGNTFVFDELTITNKDKPYISVTDKMGNVNIYYFLPTKKQNDDKCIGELIAENSDVYLTLEAESPSVDITIPEKYHSYIVGENIWYSDDIEYIIYASDVIKDSENNINSGLNHVDVYENNNEAAKYSEYEFSSGDIKYSFNNSQFNEIAQYTYNVSEAGHYDIKAVSYDNADNKQEISKSFNIDKVSPKVVLFKFGELFDEEPYFERTTYGYFFKQETEVRIYVDDEGFSSGINKVILNLSNVVNSENSSNPEVSGEQLQTDENGTYASFRIPVGFKGTVSAEVIDNVEHTSEKVYADGNIIEDDTKHSETSHIDIQPNKHTGYTDATGIVPLYNEIIPLTVTVNDAFSGIERIEWSIANDGKSGVITVDQNGSYHSDSENAVIMKNDENNSDNIITDNNLVTALKFALTVESNTNGNFVSVRLIDRAGNSSETSKIYSIDKTSPIITAVLKEKDENGNEIESEEKKYYNKSQKLNVTIQERNFCADDVEIILTKDGIESKLSWKGEPVIAESDEATHTFSYDLEDDGNYSFKVRYIDKAGNYGLSDSRGIFTIDKTAPVIENNFADLKGYFNRKSTERDSNDNIVSCDATAKIVITETNFDLEKLGLKIFCMSAGTSHYKNDWIECSYGEDEEREKNYEYYILINVKNEDNIHTIEIPFKKEFVYKIEINDSVDLAKNAAVFQKGLKNTKVFETDYTLPVIVARKDKEVKPDDTQHFEIYKFEQRNAPSPSITFEDKNLEKVKYDYRQYVTIYSNGDEIEAVRPTKNLKNQELKQIIRTGESCYIKYLMDDFKKNGVYSFKFVAIDKAGNESELNDNTYVRMIDPNTKVLAYIENSNSENKTGWFSFANENGSISKKPESFSEIDIVVFAEYDKETDIYLVNTKDENDKYPTNITSDPECLFDSSMYKIGVYKYKLPGSYFSDTFHDGIDIKLHLIAENDGEKRTLGEIYIDSKKPECKIPDDLKDWAYYKADDSKTLIFEVDEQLNIDKTIAKVDGQEIEISGVNGKETDFKYDPAEKKLYLTLSTGSHSLSMKLFDMAENETETNNFKHIAIGFKGQVQNYGLAVSFILIAICIAVFGYIFYIKKKQK